MNKELEKYKRGYDKYFKVAEKELKQGKKESHWMWFIFPQLKGLGKSDISIYFGIKDLKEAQDFCVDKYLCKCLTQLFKIVNSFPDYEYLANCFGKVDTLKLRSCATLFWLATRKNVFKKTIKKFYNDELDTETVKLAF